MTIAFTPPTPPELSTALDRWQVMPHRLGGLRDAWNGTRPASFLSKESREAIDKRLGKLGVNFPRLAVTALAERLTLSGLDIDRPEEPIHLWGAFLAANGPELAEQVHTDRLLYGAAYATVWATEEGIPTLTGDSPFSMTHGADPATGETLWAARRYSLDGETRVVIYDPDNITTYVSKDQTSAAASTFKHLRTEYNPLGVCPVVPFIRRASLSDPMHGSSYVADVLDLSDAVAKLLGDGLVTSEYSARPRRWATGLEIEEDEDGNPIDPFGTSRLLQSEDPETKFGQLPATGLDGYTNMVATLTQQIGALTGLPPHYLGLHGDQPASADGIRAAEAQLTSRARAEQRRCTSEWARVAWLLDAVREGSAPVAADLRDTRVSWETPETSTPAMDADAAVKLRTIGVPLEPILTETLGWSPDLAEDIAARAEREAILRGASDA